VDKGKGRPEQARPIHTITHVGARVASQHCPILRMGANMIELGRISCKERRKTSYPHNSESEKSAVIRFCGNNEGRLLAFRGDVIGSFFLCLMDALGRKPIHNI